MLYMLFLLFHFSSLGTYPTDLDVKRCRSHSLLVFSLSFFFLFICYPPNFFRPAFLRCATLVIYWSSIHRPSLRATSWKMAQCKDGIGRFTPHSSPSAAVVCIAARRVHSIAFALTVSAPASSPILFSSASHFLKKALRVCNVHVSMGQSLNDWM
jgi:hypothetical protein